MHWPTHAWRHMEMQFHLLLSWVDHWLIDWKRRMCPDLACYVKDQECHHPSMMCTWTVLMACYRKDTPTLLPSRFAPQSAIEKTTSSRCARPRVMLNARIKLKWSDHFVGNRVNSSFSELFLWCESWLQFTCVWLEVHVSKIGGLVLSSSSCVT